MVASVIILVISTLLFLYWFRYTCLLILNTKTSVDYTSEVASANQLEFPRVQSEIPSAARDKLDGLQGALDRDFQHLKVLLDRTACVEVDADSTEEIVLRLDYSAMRLIYNLSRRFSNSLARRSLSEMSLIVAHFANTFGDRTAAAPVPIRSS